MEMKKNISLSEIFQNDEKLKDYICSLEDDIATSETVDITVDELLTNLINAFDGFKDRRTLRASNIDAITALLKLKSELPLQRVKIKKTALDILTKKKELEIKEKTASAVSNIALNSGELLRSIYLKLDQQSIHPVIDDVDVITAECSEIIEQPKKLEAFSKVEKEQTKQSNDFSDVTKLQMSLDLDSINSTGEDADG